MGQSEKRWAIYALLRSVFLFRSKAPAIGTAVGRDFPDRTLDPLTRYVVIANVELIVHDDFWPTRGVWNTLAENRFNRCFGGELVGDRYSLPDGLE